jgi:Co/Zn/Cd efflux system component
MMNPRLFHRSYRRFLSDQSKSLNRSKQSPIVLPLTSKFDSIKTNADHKNNHSEQQQNENSKSNTSQKKWKDPLHKAVLATKLGAVANLFLAVSKGFIGVSISSTGLIADAANSMGDLVCDSVVYFTVQEARRKPSPDRPWGRGKFEPLGLSLS